MGFQDARKEAGIVLVLLEDGPAFYSSVEDVVKSAGILDSERTGHGRRIL